MSKAMSRSICLLVALGCLSARALQATTLTVQADGLGDYPTLQAAIDAAASGDTVLALPGTYTGAGNKNLDFHGVNLVLTSEAGSEATIIDGERSGQGLSFTSGEDSTSLVDGFTISRCGASLGGGIYCEDASPTFRNVTLSDCSSANYGGGAGGGMYLKRSNARLSDVQFVDNEAGHTWDGWNGLGAGLAAFESSPVLERVVFANNHVFAGSSTGECCPWAVGGGAYFGDCSPVIRDCLFYGNSAEQYGAAGGRAYGGALGSGGSIVLERTTLVENGGPGAIYVRDGDITLDHCIIAYHYGSAPVITENAAATALCCDLYSDPFNPLWIGALAGQGGVNGNFSADPFFCYHPTRDYRLAPGSPCLPEGNDCGALIGGLGPGCGDTPVFLASFRAAASLGLVTLTWQASAEGQFRLEGARDGASWDVPWQDEGEGRYAAADASPALAAGGAVTYRLHGRLPGEDWMLLRTAVVDVPAAARRLSAHPNPFNPSTELEFVLAEASAVDLAIYDLAGRRVAGLVHERRPAGRHAATWDGRDARGRQAASGVYLARLMAAGQLTETKLVLLK